MLAGGQALLDYSLLGGLCSQILKLETRALKARLLYSL